MPATEAPPEPPQAAPAAAKMGAMFRQKLSGQEAKPIVPVPEKSALPPEKPVTQNAKPETPPTAATPPKKAPEMNFKALNDEFDKFRATSESRIKEIEAQRTKEREELANELTTTKTELQKKQELVERFYLEHDDRFKAAFDEKINEAVDTGKRAAGKELAAKVEAIFKMPPGEWRDEQFAAVHGAIESELGQSRLMDAYKELEKTQSAREKALASPSQNREKLKQLDEQNSMFQRVEHKRLKEALYADIVAKGEQVFPDLKLIEGNDEHNARVNEDRQRLKDFITGDLSPTDIGNLSLYAIKGMRAIQTDEVKDQLIAQLQAQVQKLTTAQPSVSGTGRKADPSTGGKPDTDRVVSRYHQAMAAGGVPD